MLAFYDSVLSDKKYSKHFTSLEQSQLNKQRVKVKSRLSDFFQKFFSSCPVHLHLSAFFPSLYELFIPLSTTNFNVVRHQATVIGLIFLSSTAKLQSSLSSKKKPDNSELDLLNKLSDSYDTLFTAVFVNRFKDWSPHVRCSALEFFTDTILNHPTQLFRPENQKYLVWMLNDQLSDEVRKTALGCLTRLYLSKQASLLTLLSEKFEGRYVEMALADVSGNVRLAAMELIRAIISVVPDQISPEKVEEVCQWISFEDDVTIRSVIGDIIAVKYSITSEVQSSFSWEAFERVLRNYAVVIEVETTSTFTSHSELIDCSKLIDGLWDSCDLIKDFDGIISELKNSKNSNSDDDQNYLASLLLYSSRRMLGFTTDFVIPKDGPKFYNRVSLPKGTRKSFIKEMEVEQDKLEGLLADNMVELFECFRGSQSFIYIAWTFLLVMDLDFPKKSDILELMTDLFLETQNLQLSVSLASILSLYSGEEKDLLLSKVSDEFQGVLKEFLSIEEGELMIIINKLTFLNRFQLVRTDLSVLFEIVKHCIIKKTCPQLLVDVYQFIGIYLSNQLSESDTTSYLKESLVSVFHYLEQLFVTFSSFSFDSKFLDACLRLIILARCSYNSMPPLFASFDTCSSIFMNCVDLYEQLLWNNVVDVTKANVVTLFYWIYIDNIKSDSDNLDSAVQFLKYWNHVNILKNDSELIDDLIESRALTSTHQQLKKILKTESSHFKDFYSTLAKSGYWPSQNHFDFELLKVLYNFHVDHSEQIPLHSIADTVSTMFRSRGIMKKKDGDAISMFTIQQFLEFFLSELSSTPDHVPTLQRLSGFCTLISEIFVRRLFKSSASSLLEQFFASVDSFKSSVPFEVPPLVSNHVLEEDPWYCFINLSNNIASVSRGEGQILKKLPTQPPKKTSKKAQKVKAVVKDTEPPRLDQRQRKKLNLRKLLTMIGKEEQRRLSLLKRSL
ncbi:hypothetical protein GEMRC1_007189 [Eukaryota sp. GEM-RC1]